MNGEQLVIGLGGVDHLVQLGQRHGDRLLADDVLAGVQRGAHQLAVLVIGRGDQHQIEQIALQEFVQRVKADQAGFAGLGHARRIDVIRGDNLNVVHLGGVLQMPVTHIAKADNTHLNAHYCVPPDQ